MMQVLQEGNNKKHRRKSIIGFTRFSVLTKSEQERWQVGKMHEFDAYCKIILEESRLKQRFDHLINYQLPYMKIASEQYNFMYVIFTTTLLPEWIKSQFILLAERYRWIKPIYLDMDDQLDLDVLREFIINDNEFAEDLATEDYMGVFRIDDDDVVNSVYFDTLSEFVCKEFAGMCISLCNGYKGLFENGKYVLFSGERTDINISAGLAYIALYNKYNGFSANFTMLIRTHKYIHKVYQTICYAKSPYYIRGISTTNAIHWRRAGCDINEIISDHFKNTTNVSDVQKDFPIFKIEGDALYSSFQWHDSSGLVVKF
jgi:hypothetical protein